MGKKSIDLSPPLAKLYILYREDHRNFIVDGIFMVFFNFLFILDEMCRFLTHLTCIIGGKKGGACCEGTTDNI